MKKVLLFSILILNFLCFAKIARAKSKSDKTLLWRVSNKNMQKPSYLFGTIHIICPQDYFWTETMKQSLDQTEQVCLEMDMDDPQLITQIAAGMLDKSGKKIKDYFTEEQYKGVEKFLKDSFGMNMASFQQMKPAVLHTLLMSKVIGCENAVSYETNIMETAQKNNKEILGLESAAEQLDLFDNLPSDSVAQYIVHLTGNVSNERIEYNKLVSTYKKQDLPKLYDLIKQSKDIDLGGFLDTRNEKWIPRMIEKMDQKSVFFAVGAGHLWGDNGIINLLRKAGYTVEPIK